MAEPGAAPDWVTKQVLPHVQGAVRSLHMVTPRSALVFTQDHALVAEKATLRGVQLYRIDYPPGLLVNGARCPHCGQQVLEPIGKVARLADEAPAESARAPAERRAGRAKKAKRR